MPLQEPLRDGILIIGIVVIILIAVANLYDPQGKFMRTRNKADAWGIKLAYPIAIMGWVCIVSFPEWLSGIERSVGPGLGAWTLAIVGLAVLIVVSFICWFVTDEGVGGWGTEIAATTLWLVVVFGYIGVAVGFERFWVDPTP